jgi:hypothetical protein
MWGGQPAVAIGVDTMESCECLLERLPAVDPHDKVLGERHRLHELAEKLGAVLLLFNEDKNHLGCDACAVIERSLEGNDWRAVLAAFIFAWASEAIEISDLGKAALSKDGSPLL